MQEILELLKWQFTLNKNILTRINEYIIIDWKTFYLCEIWKKHITVIDESDWEIKKIERNKLEYIIN